MPHRVRVSVRVSVVYAKVYNFSWPYLAARSARHDIVIEYRLSVMCRTWVSVPSLIRHGLDWPLNASSALSTSAELLVLLRAIVKTMLPPGSIFKLKIHQMRLPHGLRPGLIMWSLRRSARPPSCFKGPLRAGGGGEGKGEEEGKEGEGMEVLLHFFFYTLSTQYMREKTKLKLHVIRTCSHQGDLTTVHCLSTWRSSAPPRGPHGGPPSLYFAIEGSWSRLWEGRHLYDGV